MRTRSSVLATLTLVATSALVTACGGGGASGDGVASLSGAEGADSETTDTTLSEEEAEEALLDWAACMREQGIDMPDPQFSEGGGIRIQVGRESGGDEGDGGSTGAMPLDRDTLDAASETCGEPPRIGGEFTEEDREEMEASSLEFAECMRDNGVPDFPDPDFSDFGPGSGPQTRSSEDRDTSGDDEGSGPRIAGPFGEVDLGDPAVEAAFEECRDIAGIPDGGGPPGVGGAADVRPATRAS